MESIVAFFIKSVLLGVGLAMDAFSVSLANGLNNPKMKKTVILGISAMFSFFQFAMPVIGWICVKTVANIFKSFQIVIPWISLILLSYIGIKLLLEGIHDIKCSKDHVAEKMLKTLSFGALVLQGIATSIDALSVGFTIASYNTLEALGSGLIIGVVTFIICVAGVLIGKKFGTKLGGWANVLGGVILIGIGLEIFISNLFF